VSTDRAELERSIRHRCEGGDPDGALAEALRGFGPEIYGFLVATTGDRSAADDVFSQFAEDVWHGLSRFDWRGATLRTWLYVVARHAAARRRRGKRRDLVPLSHESVARIAEHLRTATATFLRTEQKDRLAALRASLPDEDRELLVLRVDRNLAWDDLARVMIDAPAPDAATVKREAARLRKRFERLRAELIERARREGLLGER
jgi:RNA polymerase sigma-70 factor (ECF subfamily)